MYKIPAPLPWRYVLQGGVIPPPSNSTSSEFDVAFGGLGFRLSNSVESPILRQLADTQRQRVDQAEQAGEQTLTGWWLRSQESFHAGAGQLNLEPTFKHASNKIRFDTSKNLDVWTPGHVSVLPAARTVAGALSFTTPGTGVVSLTSASGDAFAYGDNTNLRVTVVGANDPNIRYNLCPNSTFTFDTTNWINAGVPTPTSAVTSVTHSMFGATSMLVTWPAAGVALSTKESFSITTVAGQQYTASAYVWVPAGHPPVRIKLPGIAGAPGLSAVSTLTGAWERLSLTFTANTTFHEIGITPNTATTAGQQVFVDGVMVERGPTLGAWFDTGASSTVVDVTTTVAMPSKIIKITTDGKRVFFVCANGSIYRSDEASSWAATEIYSGPFLPQALEWVADRLLYGVSSKVYQLDPNKVATSVLGATELVFTHPSTFSWDGFIASPRAILGYGWNGLTTTFTEFTLTNAVGTIPVLAPSGVVMTLPPGERCLSALTVMGSFLALSTTAGVRIAQFDQYQSKPSAGPLTVVDVSLGGLSSWDRFIYVTSHTAPDEPGLIRIDLGVQTDDAGRFAWANDRVGPVPNSTVQAHPGDVTVLPVTGRIIFTDDQGIYLSDPALPVSRTGFLRTSRVRYSMTEPKLFKFGRVRGDFTEGPVSVSANLPEGAASNLLAWSGPGDTGEFALPPGALEWLQLTFTLGGGARLDSFQVKALPGVKHQELIQVVVSCQDRESSRSGQAYVRPRSAGPRLDALMELAADSDEIIFQEFRQNGAVGTRVVIEQCVFKQTGRPTPQQFDGGDITVSMRTIA